MMKFTEKIILHIEDPLKWFKLLQKVIAGICILIPLFLWLADHDCFNPVMVGETAFTQVTNCRDSFSVDTYVKTYCLDSETRWIIKDCRTNKTIIDAAKIKKDRLGFRASVSNYAYSSNSYIFGLLYCLAAILFIYNGIIHIKITHDKARFESTNLNKNGSWYYITIGVSLLLIVFFPLHSVELLHFLFTGIFFGAGLLAIIVLPNKHESKTTRYIVAAAAVIALAIAIFHHAILWGEWVALAIIAIHLFFIADSAKIEQNPGYKKNVPFSNDK